MKSRAGLWREVTALDPRRAICADAADRVARTPPERRLSATAEAREAGIGRGRLRGKDLAHPFRGIHVAGYAPEDLTGACESLLPALGPSQWFSHLTAARLWGMPTPFFWSPEEPLHVLALGDTPPMRRDGVVGWETESADIPGRLLGLLPVIDPAAVWCQLSVPGALGPRRAMTPEWLVAAGDFLLSGAARSGPETHCALARTSWRPRSGTGASAATRRCRGHWSAFDPVSIRPRSHFCASASSKPACRSRSSRCP